MRPREHGYLDTNMKMSLKLDSSVKCLKSRKLVDDK